MKLHINEESLNALTFSVSRSFTVGNGVLVDIFIHLAEAPFAMAKSNYLLYKNKIKKS